MAELVQITLFTFDELPEESQQKLIEGFRKDYDPFYDHIYDEFIKDMSEKYGADIDVDNIQWSGFWSQGDGASFTCDFDASVILPILKKALHEDDAAYFEKQELEIDASSIRVTSLYCHEHTVSGNLILYGEPCERSDKIHGLLEDHLTAIIRDSCTDLYEKLKEEYERAISDDAMIEEIKNIWPGCNFRKDGTIFAR